MPTVNLQERGLNVNYIQENGLAPSQQARHLGAAALPVVREFMFWGGGPAYALCAAAAAAAAAAATCGYKLRILELAAVHNQSPDARKRDACVGRESSNILNGSTGRANSRLLRENTTSGAAAPPALEESVGGSGAVFAVQQVPRGRRLKEWEHFSQAVVNMGGRSPASKIAFNLVMYFSLARTDTAALPDPVVSWKLETAVVQHVASVQQQLAKGEPHRPDTHNVCEQEGEEQHHALVQHGPALRVGLLVLPHRQQQGPHQAHAHKRVHLQLRPHVWRALTICSRHGRVQRLQLLQQLGEERV
eukprot:CAMPEP_0177678098 /NCGR_PEP_ID=MMETSP0447-20121125/28817_1 /TAXON_ID=0 /ORGANISM="Stygamoeba regulata, Strain BSH-02190019" /LENGTH=303 /DNA_ID=CAMNT_0019187057 /DNA_START=210 /DNA_END=1118 /DNA_ORIENTATION=-